jgi:hypothetical protein
MKRPTQKRSQGAIAKIAENGKAYISVKYQYNTGKIMELPPFVAPEEIFDILKAFRSVKGDLEKAAEYLGTMGKGKSASRWAVAFATAKKFELLQLREEGGYEPTQDGYRLLNFGPSNAEAKDLLRRASEKHEKFAEAVNLLNDELQNRGSMSPTEIGQLLRIKYSPKWSDSTANSIGRAYTRWLEFFDLADVSRGKVVPKGAAVSEIELPTEAKAEAGISIPSPRYAVPSFKVAAIIFSLGRLEQIAKQKNLEETKKEIGEIKDKLQDIYPEAVAVSELLLEYLESSKKIDEYSLKMTNKLLELVRSRYFRES